MANEKWKALYEYEYSPVLWMFYFMSGIGGLCLIIMALFFAHNSDERALIVVLASPITIMSIFLTISQSASTVRNRMYKYGVEFVCKKKGLLLVRTATLRTGLFTTNGKVIIKPEYRNIVFSHNYYLLENEKGLWGAYNPSLKKQVIECDYTHIKVENSENITVEKEDMRYTFSPYGTLIHKINTAHDNLINQIMGSL